MNARLRYAAADPCAPPGLLVRLLRTLILFGVWTLVGLSGVAAWSHLAT